MSSLKDFKDLNILVIGDIILDIFLYGQANRISPEAPIPVVEILKETRTLGGAGNVAANLTSIGVNTYLIGIIGNDTEGNNIKTLLQNHKIDSNFLLLDSRITSVKTRVIASSQQLIRFDKENTNKIEKNKVLKAVKNIESIINKIDGIIISDYGKGMISSYLIKEITKLVKKHNIILTVDPKIEHFNMYKNVSCLTPNQKEASEATKIKLKSDDDIVKCGKTMIKKLNCASLIITRGAAGMTLFNNNDKPVHIKAAAKEVYDVTGAGDTVISIFTAAKACGFDITKAAQLANKAAGIVVSKIGTATVAREELQKILGDI